MSIATETPTEGEWGPRPAWEQNSAVDCSILIYCVVSCVVFSSFFVFRGIFSFVCFLWRNQPAWNIIPICPIKLPDLCLICFICCMFPVCCFSGDCRFGLGDVSQQSEITSETKSAVVVSTTRVPATEVPR